MKIAIVTFSFNKDEELLWYSSKAHLFFNKDKKFDIDFYLINDGNNPVVKIPENYNVINSYVDRGANISTLAFIREQYKIYHDIINKKDYDFLIKVDSDTWIENLNCLFSMDPKEICEGR